MAAARLNFGFVKNWTWVHWVALAAVLVISVKEVYENQVKRLQVLDQNQVEVIEQNIQEYNTMAERLAQLEVLPPVKEQWKYVPAIAGRYGVDLNVLSNPANMYDGPLRAWNGQLEGKVGSVLVAALEIQQTVPTYLYKLNIKNGKATLGFSVLGSE
ncbi:hypothetical protein [Ketobacter sp.]|uniref:hypothetical protein n=1 Tax=Ketobacter sp. TaxID=2083498 RepID=UPI000F275827|nr:hypothetical protein [Ketobacter sp.]RLU00531.1 MAG: hypothetical protein D9N14_06305 [Ketobacter sp.]